MPAKPDTPDTPTRGFTEASDALTQILDRFRRGQLPLEEAMTLFEEGVKALHDCQRALNAAEGKVKQLMDQLGDDGQPVLKEIDIK